MGRWVVGCIWILVSKGRRETCSSWGSGEQRCLQFSSESESMVLRWTKLVKDRCHIVNSNLVFFGVTVVMAANRECGCHLPASQSISALVRGCSLQKTWLPQSLASEGVIWTWNNLPLSDQGSNSATCRTCRVSLRRSELAVSYA